MLRLHNTFVNALQKKNILTCVAFKETTTNYISLEWFSVECRKTKTKVITLANHKEHTQYREPIKTRSNYRQLTQSAGKRVRVLSRLVLVLLLIGCKIGANILSQSCSAANAKPITFRLSNENRSITSFAFYFLWIKIIKQTKI